MPLQSLQLRPGINREGTSLSNEGGWYECDKIRFRSGYPQKLGGWKPITSQTYQGVARALFNWVTLRGYNLLGVGTNTKYYVESGGVFNDITPYRSNVTLSNPFTTSNGSSTVLVTDNAYGGITNDSVTFSNASTVAGLNLNGEFLITFVDGNSYYITANGTANATVTGGGSNVNAKYEINVGLATYGYLAGWNTGLWGGFQTGVQQTKLSVALNSSNTNITVTSTTGFPSGAGTVMMDSELAIYSGNTATIFTGSTRGANGTVATAHANNTVVYDAGTFTGWGQSVTSSTGTQIRLWSQATFGEYLIINPRNGSLYMYIPEYTGAGILYFDNHAKLLSSSSASPYVTDAACPVAVAQVMVSDASRFVLAFGCNDYGSQIQDPLLIRWSDQESYSTWLPSVTNQAGSYRLSSGSTIVSAVQTKQEIVVFTDAACYSMQYLGPPYVWGFTILSNNISIMGPNAVAAANNIVYWMGLDKFYIYTGRVETLPCSLRQYVYGDINLEQNYQIFSGSNEGYSEIWWYYCSANSTTVDRYVIYNYLDKVWYYGNLNRSAWLDSPLRNYPMAATYQHTLVYHEDGNDDVEVSGTALPINSYIQSSDFDIGDGHNYGFVWRIIPDLTFDGSNNEAPAKPSAVFTIKPRQNPGAPYGTADAPVVQSAQSYALQRNYVVQEFTQIVYTRLRGRQMAFKISSDTLGTQWQLGVPRADIVKDGRR